MVVLRNVLLASLLLTLAACAPVSSIPPEPTSADAIALFQLRVDTVWAETGLAHDKRPEVPLGQPFEQYEIGGIFAGCMADRGWPDYFVEENAWGYQSLSEASSDEERLDWYECFAAHPMTNARGLKSVAQADFVYDYFQEQLIPCLGENGFLISHAPSRSQFRAGLDSGGDPFSPIVWNPYYFVPGYSGPVPLPVTEQCPPEPPHQTFYVAY